MPHGEGPWPGVVFVHGAGDETRDASRFLATYYAQHGIASLIYDKRGVGQSGGDWHTVGFDALAEDVLAGVEVLRQRAGIDPSAVGVRGQSQGGWIAPLAASRSRTVAFVITAAGPLVTPAEEGHWDTLFALRTAGYHERAIAEAEALLGRRDEAVRTGTWDTFRTALTKAQQRSWFEASGVSSEVDPDSWIWEWYRHVMDFDPVPVFEGLTIPVLAQFGAQDESIPAEKSAAILEGIRDQGRKPFTVVVYPSTNHAMRNVVKGPAFHWPEYVGGFLDRQVEWILRRATRGSANGVETP
jgi:dienelactone hydrolase